MVDLSNDELLATLMRLTNAITDALERSCPEDAFPLLSQQSDCLRVIRERMRADASFREDAMGTLNLAQKQSNLNEVLALQGTALSDHSVRELYNQGTSRRSRTI